MSKLEQLESFIKVVEHKGITRAALALNLTSSAVTKQIQSLEKHVGTALFDRVGRNLVLTEIGERYYQEAVNTLKNLQQLESFIQTGRKQVAGILKVRCMQFIANQRLYPKLAGFLEQYPQLQINIELLENIPDMWKEGIDIMYGMSYPGLPDWVQKKIGSTDLILCASPKYLAEFGTPKSPNDLQTHRYLAHSARKSNHLIRLAQQQNVIVAPYLWCSTHQGLISAALENIGFIWTHKAAVQDLLNNGQLVEILPNYVLRDQPMYLYYQSGQYIDPKIRAFVDFYSELPN
jgi:DNA-binding transcriptional LysR family regulator